MLAGHMRHGTTELQLSHEQKELCGSIASERTPYSTDEFVAVMPRCHASIPHNIHVRWAKNAGIPFVCRFLNPGVDVML